MFDFEKLQVYQMSKNFNIEINKIISSNKLHSGYRDQLRRASFSIILNIAEGTGRFTNPDRKNFYIVSRSSLFECVAILDVLFTEGNLEEKEYRATYAQADEISRILFSMIRNLSTGAK